MFAGAFAIALKDLRQRFRDRSALVLGFVAPILIVVLMNAAFGGAAELHVKMGLVDADGGPVGAGLRQALASPELADLVEVVPLDDAAAARRAVRAGDVDAALVLPAGLTAMAAGGAPVAVEVFSSVDAELAGDITASLAGSFSSRVATARLTARVAQDLGLPAGRVAQLAAAAGAAPPVVYAEAGRTGSRELQGVAYFGPSMGMFFVLFAVGFTARSFFLERSTGTLDRMVASPIRPEAVLLGKGLSVLLYATASLLTMAVVAGPVLGASWGSPVGVVALCLGMAVAVVALAILVMGLARTERQSEAYSSAITFGLALMGGTFMFLGSAPTLLRRLAVLTPNGWAVRGFTDLGTGVDTWSAIALPLAGMAAFSVVVGVVALAVGRGALVR